jgi:adenosine deaminase
VSSTTVITADRYEAARADYAELRAFLHRMPKGGDLHVHLSGAVYAERFIAWTAQDGLCANWSE